MTIDIGALGAVAGAILSIYGAYLLLKKIFVGKIMDELAVLVECLAAVLDGLEQQGCNGAVTEAKNKLTQRLNEQAHQ